MASPASSGRSPDASSTPSTSRSTRPGTSSSRRSAGLGFLGGTLLQLARPAAFVVYFWRRSDRHAATVALWWVAQNCWNVSVYVADARAQMLPLVGGGEHDWAYLLGRLGWLRYDAALALDIRIAGAAIYVYAIAAGVRYATRGVT